ncbi:MAG: transpeptidase family protein [Deltaproteobacteria bacterium]|nr:MAG: transpeptidase family protein [Deltaproteobacteria bacterium]
MKVKKKKWIRFRIYLVAFFFLFGLGTILARAYQLQVLERDKLASLARAGYRGTIKLLPKRGTIYDREGHELAVSVEVESVYAHPNLVKKKAYAARRLSRTLNVSQRKILGLLRSKRPFVWIKRKISPKEVRRVKTLGLEGVGFTTETRRYYPGREIGAHLIGFAGADNQGLEGLERKYDRVLKGPQYTLVQMRDALGRPFYISRPTSHGPEMHRLILTIDKDIQYRAQQALQSAVEKAGAKSGHCIILNPETGEILAMAVVPLFNPNIFWKYRPHQWRNRTITDTYEPGSTIKAFLLAAALETRSVSPQTTFYCEQGEFQLANHIIHDTKEFGSLSVSDIIAFSSNIGAVKVGQKLGYERFGTYLKKFGFGSKTGIDLIGERSGFIRPVKETKEIDRATIFFGQGMTVSSLQLAVAMAAIANGGKLIRPYVVKAVKDKFGRIVKETKPQMIRRVISLHTSKKVARVLEEVVSEEGTGPLAAIGGYRVAGKTGTSQKVDVRTKSYSDDDYVAIFVGFVPVDRPKLVILVMVDEPKGKPYGGLVAGPAFREVGAWALNHLRITPQFRLVKVEKEQEMRETRTSQLNLEPKTRSGNPGLLPDFRGQSMREVLKGGRALGLNVVLEGTGLAVKQTPRPGSSLKKIRTVKVSFRPPR